jgi:hypothetical protein
MATPEQALRETAAFLDSDLASRAGVVRGKAMWEFDLELSTPQGHAFDVRVKVWPASGESAGSYEWATSVTANESAMGIGRRTSSTTSATVTGALQDAIDSVRGPVLKALDAGKSFDKKEWLTPNRPYGDLPLFKD